MEDTTQRTDLELALGAQTEAAASKSSRRDTVNADAAGGGPSDKAVMGRRVGHGDDNVWVRE